MFGVASGSAEPAADADPRVDLESFRSIGKYQLDRRRAFPIAPVLAWVGVNPIG